MVSPEEKNLVYNVRLSSVGPGRVTGEDVVYEPTAMDLAMKLHYLKAVYWFSSEVAQGLTIKQLKEPTFSLLNDYYMACGRFKRSNSGRPYIKCNDCGVRFVEAHADHTVEEWLELQVEDDSLNKLLVYHKPIGPELSFCPLVFLQVTRFKCGGISLGLSWAHVLGDPFSASDFMNVMGQYLARLKSNGPPPNHATALTKTENPDYPTRPIKEPLSAKRVDPVGDLWITASNCKMGTLSFLLTQAQITKLQAKISEGNENGQIIPPFEALCATIWQCIAKVREGNEPEIVTVCKKDLVSESKTSAIPSNTQIVSAVQANFSVAEAELKMLAMLLAGQGKDERSQIEEAMERENGVSDYFVYGANLTFLNLEDANIYGLEVNGNRPKMAYYSLEGVGDEGAVLVLPGPKDSSVEEDGYKGRLVTIILPEDQVFKLKSELKKCNLLPQSDLE